MEKMKWVYTLIMLLVTIGWAIFTIEAVSMAMELPTSVSVLEASGTSVLLGALIGWNAIIIQYWFRKKSPPPPTNTPG